MKLKELISINDQYTQSINIERDESSIDRINAYVPTAITKKALASFVDASADEKKQKAWSYIGPYGSGKSFFAVFLNALLSDPKTEATKVAHKKLSELDPKLANKFSTLLKDSDGFFRILVSGSVEPIEEKLFDAISDSAKNEIFSKTDQEILNEKIESIRSSEEINSTNIFQLLELIQKILTKKSKIKGLLIVIDELGKFVQFAGRNKNQGDLFLLQQLAEKTAKASSCQLHLIAMLHQSLDVYARDLDEETKNEWKKIQGRFNEISFVESPEQSLKILSKAISLNLSSAQQAKLQKQFLEILKTLEAQKALPPGMSLKESEKIFFNCYPLHPTTAVLLPILSQKIGQNERTMFSFLGSQQEYGFIDSLNSLNFEDNILPHDLFDYFVTNQSSYIADHSSSQQWLEVSDALHHLGEVDPSLSNLIKTIGLISIVGKRGGLVSSSAILESIFDKKLLEKNIEILKNKRLIKYSEFSETFKVWEGSDIDVENELKQELAQLGSISAAEELNSLNPLMPIIAKKHSIENGLLRYFEMEYMDEETLKNYKSEATEPKIIVLLKGRTFKDSEYENLIAKASKQNIFVEVDAKKYLIPMIEKFVAFNNLSKRLNQDNSDRVGRREVLLKLDECETAINSEIKTKINPVDSNYYWQGKKLDVNSNRRLQEKLSEIFDNLYANSPKIFNELINRNSLSSQGASARVKLLKRMLEHKNESDLGFEAELFPPEKSVYNALFKNHDLHGESENTYNFKLPDSSSPFFAVFQKLEEFIQDSNEPVSYSTLKEIMSAPPFGLKEGVMPLIFMSFYFAKENNFALYEDNIYRPYMDIEAIERFSKKTNAFSFQLFNFESQQDLIKRYSTVLNKDDSKKADTLSMVKEISKLMRSLPPFVRNTRLKLSAEAIKFRTSFATSKSPQDLLAKDIPQALGFKPEMQDAELNDFSKKLDKVLSDLRSCYERLLKEQLTKFNQAFEYENTPLKALRENMYNDYFDLDDRSVDPDVKNFLRKISEKEIVDQMWFESLLSFLVKKHPEKWEDEDLSSAEYELRKLSDKLRELRKLGVYSDNSKAREEAQDSEVYLLRTKKKGDEGFEELFSLTSEDQNNLKDIASELDKVLGTKFKKDDKKIAALTSLLNSMLEGKSFAKIDKKPDLKIVKKDE